MENPQKNAGDFVKYNFIDNENYLVHKVMKGKTLKNIFCYTVTMLYYRYTVT